MIETSGDGDGEALHHQARQEHQAHQELPTSLDRLARVIVDAGLAVHKTLGPGPFESTCEHCLVHELKTRGVSTRRQVSMPIIYKNVKLDAGYRLEMVVEDLIIVEIKSIEALTRLHEAQILTYLRLSGHRLGFLMNFNVALFKNGVRWLVL